MLLFIYYVLNVHVLLSKYYPDLSWFHPNYIQIKSG